MSPSRNRRARETGFTLIEILVVLVLIAAISAVGVMSIGSARNSGQRIGAIAAANTYAQAAERFARDHGGRYPEAPGSAEWGSGAGAVKGPYATILGERKHYVRQAPESVQSGTIHVNSGTLPAIEYSTIDGGYGFEIAVKVENQPDCVIRGGSTTGSSGTAKC